MSKQNEINYLLNIGEAEKHHAVNKPYSDVNCGSYLLDMGMLLSIIPQPPARVLDLGAGTGWTSVFLAKKGYRVVGQDISEHSINVARAGIKKEGLTNIEFIVADYEHLTYENEFDIAVFYDCLHHADDAFKALASAYQALKTGGMCITFEPGSGHSKSPGSKKAIELWGVNENDMPPQKIIKAAKRIGFRKQRVFLRIQTPIKTAMSSLPADVLQLLKIGLRWLPIIGKRKSNIVVLIK